ncbi:hypothetical protein MTO96_024218 [Rhipicephalus appendiculatus]
MLSRRLSHECSQQQHTTFTAAPLWVLEEHGRQGLAARPQRAKAVTRRMPSRDVTTLTSPSRVVSFEVLVVVATGGAGASTRFLRRRRYRRAVGRFAQRRAAPFGCCSGAAAATSAPLAART